MTAVSDPAGAVRDDAAGRPADVPTGYESDFYLWCYHQAELLRLHRFSAVDLPNLVEELESMGSEQRFKLEASYRLIISHLLKWEYQPQLRSSSWEVTIVRERANVNRREAASPSLRAQAAQLVEAAYPDARREAQTETGLPRSAFPPECPYTLAQLRDPDWMPGLPSEPEPSGVEGKPAGSRRTGTRRAHK
ncbi:MAG TPA: DUF29 domain-containing protein [Beijerinckiaceae bacterium]|jgi:hypothetical protein